MKNKITQKEYEMSIKCLKLQVKNIKKLTKELEKQILKEELTREQDYYE